VSESGWVLSAVSPTVLTPARPAFHITWRRSAALRRLLAVRSAPWGTPSAASHPDSHRTRPNLWRGAR